MRFSLPFFFLVLRVGAQVTLSGVSPSGVTLGYPLQVPAPAAAVGYTLPTFISVMAQAEFDLNGTYLSGFRFYPDNFFGDTPPASATMGFSTGYATVGANNAKAQWESIGEIGTPPYYVGTAIGGGAYFEYTLRWNHANVIVGSNGWPAGWTDSWEAYVNPATNAYWSGQATGYTHFVEADPVEDDVWSYSPSGSYGAAIHDWWGVYGTTCSPGYCQVTNATGGGSNYSNAVITSPGIDFGVWHKYGMLWVPATAHASGYVSFYLDGVAQSTISWAQYVAASDSPPPGTASWTFGVLDNLHLIILFSTGVDQPMDLQSITVWQASTANNLRN